MLCEALRVGPVAQCCFLPQNPCDESAASLRRFGMLAAKGVAVQAAFEGHL